MPGNDKMRFFDRPMLFFRMRSCKECGIVEKNLSDALVKLNICQAIMVIDMDTVRGKELAIHHGIVESPRLVIRDINLGVEDLLNREKLLEVLGN
jgi:hypothetical protein